MSIKKLIALSLFLLAISCKGNMEQAEYKAREYPSEPVTPATPIDPHTGNHYGQSVALSGDTMVVGVPYDPSSERGVKHGVAGDANQEANRSGAVYVYRRVGIHWEQEAYLKSSSLSQPEEFGKRVAISGDTLVVGAPQESGGESGVKNGSMGGSNTNLTESGAAYVFRRTGNTWTQEAYLKAAHPGLGDRFGNSVAISGDTIIVGADSEDSDEIGVFSGITGGANDLRSHSGAAYVFRRTGSIWSQEAYVKAHDPAAGDNFAATVAISGDLAVVGAPYEQSASDAEPYAGAAYVFSRTGATWIQEAYLKTTSVTAQSQFGSAVAISGNTVVVGESCESSDEGGVKNGVQAGLNAAILCSGAVHVYVRSGTTWGRQAFLKSTAPREFARFGDLISIDGDTIAVGALGDGGTNNGVTNGTTGPSSEDTKFGSAYIFRRTAGLWQQEALIRAHNPGSRDRFGLVAVAGDVLAVGSPDEGSDATGIDSTFVAGMNDDLSSSGAAYTFTRAGVLWSADAFFKRTARN